MMNKTDLSCIYKITQNVLERKIYLKRSIPSKPMFLTPSVSSDPSSSDGLHGIFSLSGYLNIEVNLQAYLEKNSTSNYTS